MELLTRDFFRESVFRRDDWKCVVCKMPAADAHHLIERRLFDEAGEHGGYFLDNGVSLCELHHLEAERTSISPSHLRGLAGIKEIILPASFHRDLDYDKWGNPIVGDRRLKGPLFFEESVQRALEAGGFLGLFSDYVKHPRIWHLPTSEKLGSDDRRIQDDSPFHGKRVIVTIKMDGEQTSMYSDHIHARSIDSGSHPSRGWVKSLWAGIAHDIPRGWRICGENMYARHTIEYDRLPSYFMAFSVWNERNECLSWDESVDWFELLGLTPVPVIYDGIYDAKAIELAFGPTDRNGDKTEGYVVRLADGFSYGDFKRSIGKFVRSDFQIRDSHWMFGKVSKNGLSL